MSCIILDTEGTGLHAPDVIELAFAPVLDLVPEQDLGEVRITRWHPRKPIEPAAMATHNIILEDLLGCPTWPGTWTHDDWMLVDDHYMIGHGIDYDWKAIGSPSGIRLIDTLAISCFLWDELPSHKLGAMLYFLMPPDHARKYVANAHGAGADVAMAFFLLGYILDKAADLGLLSREPSFEDLYSLSELARVPVRMTFGKYGPKDGLPGRLYTEVEPSYLQWITRQSDMDPYVVKAAYAALTGRK